MHRLVIYFIACAYMSMPVFGDAAMERRIALVIGNSNYVNAPLRNPVSDATDMASALRKLGFSVTLKTDANQRDMEESIRSFGNQLMAGGVGLFYYAGHGIQHRGTNYLIPLHAEIKVEADVKYEAVDAGRVLTNMEDAGNNLNIIILDACRNNPYGRSFRSTEEGLAKMDAPKGSILAYATSPGSVAADGLGRNGLYTEKLLRHMPTKGLTIERMFKLVRKDVTKASGDTQIPWESSSLIGDFYFSPGQSIQPARAIAVEQKPSPQNLNAEEETWGVVKTSTVVTDYYRFLDAYPNSRFGEAAKLKIQQLKRKQDAKPMHASVSPKVSTPHSLEREGTFERLPSGIVYDSNTGLEWYAGPDQNMNWYEAQKWIGDLEIDGGGWRTPDKKELKSLYFKNPSEELKLTTLFKTSGSHVWSKRTWDISGHSAFYFYFKGAGKWDRRVVTSSFSMRAFAVRTRNNRQ